MKHHSKELLDIKIEEVVEGKLVLLNTYNSSIVIVTTVNSTQVKENILRLQEVKGVEHLKFVRT